MSFSYYLLDSFSQQKFKGNPTPVCVLEQKLDAQTMHSLAREFNAPVTAFIEPLTQDGVFPVRYFTVTGEIPACGHASLAAAFVLFERVTSDRLSFQTIEDILLKARKENEMVFIEYPKYAATEFLIPAAVKAALGVNDIINHFYCSELQSLFIELQTEEELKSISPDFRLLQQSSDMIKEVVLMSNSSNSNYDFALRSFCPWIGIDEDPVTGSIHSVLAHYWQAKKGKHELTCYQASQRGGWLHVKALDNKVEIGGHARFIVKAELVA